MILAVILILVSLPRASADQPIAFSHQAHIEKARMKCVDCHTGATTRDMAGIPSIRKCMLCHQFIGKDLTEVQRMTEYWQRQHEIPWVRIYGFPKKVAVQFRHAPHARAQVECSECHGDVGSMTVAVKAVRHTMGSCIDCHRENRASDDCLVCHF